MKFIPFLALLATLSFLNSCKKNNAPVQHKLVIDKALVNLFPNQETQLTASIIDPAGNRTVASAVQWSSSNEQIVRISTSGNIDAVATGTITIKASATIDGSVLTSSSIVKVFSSNLFLVNPSSVSTYLNTPQVPITITEQGAPSILFEFESTDPVIASVDYTGEITLKKAGKCAIKVTATNVEGQPYKIIPIEIKPHLSPNTIVRIEVKPLYSPIIFDDETASFIAKAYNSFDNEVTTTFNWSIDDPNVASINATGTATPIQEGMTFIKASAQGLHSNAQPFGVAHKCDQYNPSIMLNGSSRDNAPRAIHLLQGESRVVDLKVYPKGSSPAFTMFACSNNTIVVDVINVNTLVAKTPGTAIVTFAFGEQHASSFVFVN